MYNINEKRKKNKMVRVIYDRVRSDWVRNDRVRNDRVRNENELEMIVNPCRAPIKKCLHLYKFSKQNK